MKFYQKLEKFRLPGESDRGFAKRIGLGNHMSIQVWRRNHLTGEKENQPELATVQRIAAKIGVDWEYLLFDD